MTNQTRNPNPKKLTRIRFRTSDAQYAAVKATAEERGISMSRAVRDAVRSGIAIMRASA